MSESLRGELLSCRVGGLALQEPADTKSCMHLLGPLLRILTGTHGQSYTLAAVSVAEGVHAVVPWHGVLVGIA